METFNRDLAVIQQLEKVNKTRDSEPSNYKKNIYLFFLLNFIEMSYKFWNFIIGSFVVEFYALKQ